VRWCPLKSLRRPQSAPLRRPSACSASSTFTPRFAPHLLIYMVFFRSFPPQLPKGPAPAAKASLNPIVRYKQRYFEGENASGAPIVHAITAIFLIGCELSGSFPSFRR
jgi:hypothetical protein